MQKTRDVANGKWKGILIYFGLPAEALRNKHGPCPMCEGRDRFRFDNKNGDGTWICANCGAGDGFNLLMQYKGWDFETAAKEVDQMVGNIQDKERPPAKPDPRPRIERLQAQLVPPGEAVRSYLSGRGLGPSKAIMQVDALDYFDENRQKVGSYPAMVVPIHSLEGDLVSYHITYLQDGKKAPVPSPRKVLPPIGDLRGAARLTDIYKVLCVAEGIETALSVMKLYKFPCWATINANLMESWDPPPGVEDVLIFADRDKSYTGQKAGYVLAHRLMRDPQKRYRAWVAIPKLKGSAFDLQDRDWNDEWLDKLRAKAPETLR